MKIHQLPLGARFEYEGEEYVKTGPLFATGRAGQRLIPKYAVLKPIGDTPPPAGPAAAENLPRARVLAALDRLVALGDGLVPEDRRDDLAAARAAFLEDLARE